MDPRAAERRRTPSRKKPLFLKKRGTLSVCAAEGNPGRRQLPTLLERKRGQTRPNIHACVTRRHIRKRQDGNMPEFIISAVNENGSPAGYT